jgi:hypothetical protein
MKKLNRFIEIPEQDSEEIQQQPEVRVDHVLNVSREEGGNSRDDLKLSVVATKPFTNKF